MTGDKLNMLHCLFHSKDLVVNFNTPLQCSASCLGLDLYKITKTHQTKHLRKGNRQATERALETHPASTHNIGFLTVNKQD